MFDDDCDGKLSERDIEKIVNTLTFDASKDYEDDKDAKRPEVLILLKLNFVLCISQIDLQKVVRNVLSETDMNKSDHINLVEFKQIVSKSHDFTDNFRIKL